MGIRVGGEVCVGGRGGGGKWGVCAINLPFNSQASRTQTLAKGLSSLQQRCSSDLNKST